MSEDKWDENIRSKAKQSINKILKNQKNIDILEKYIYKQVDYMEHKEDDDKIIIYKKVVYDVINDLILKVPITDIINNIRKNNIFWNSPNFASVKHKFEEIDGFIIKPFEVLEGILKCMKCKSMKTYSYSKQTRGADEAMTTFIFCSKCGHKWTEGG